MRARLYALRVLLEMELDYVSAALGSLDNNDMKEAEYYFSLIGANRSERVTDGAVN